MDVGWGSEETQFQGSLGKDATKRNKVKVEEGPSKWEDGRIHVSWRGDGQYFVVSSVNQISGKFVFAAFNIYFSFHTAVYLKFVLPTQTPKLS